MSSKIENFFNLLFERTILLVVATIGLGGVGYTLFELGFGVYSLARTGKWAGSSTLEVLVAVVPKLAEWSSSPSDWIGVHDFFQSTPFWVLCLPISLLVAYRLYLSYKKFKDENDLLFEDLRKPGV